MDIKQRIFSVGLICLDFVAKAVGGVLCSFETSNGFLQHKYCKETCCEGPAVRYATACCFHQRESTIYIGTGMATLVGLVIFILCSVYLCCKRKILQQSRAMDSRHRNTRTSPFRENSVSTVSSQVQPPVPPPYENLPPPYFTVDERTSQTKGEKCTFPEEPPPAYSPYDTSAV